MTAALWLSCVALVLSLVGFGLALALLVRAIRKDGGRYD